MRVTVIYKLFEPKRTLARKKIVVIVCAMHSVANAVVGGAETAGRIFSAGSCRTARTARVHSAGSAHSAATSARETSSTWRAAPEDANLATTGATATWAAVGREASTDDIVDETVS